MGQFFADNPWVTLFAVIALGALLGLVRFGPVRLGAAGVRVLLTNPDLAGRTVGELGLGERYGAVVSRVRRGDLDMLAHDDLLLQLDDRVRVVMPRGRTGEVTTSASS